MAKVIKNKPVLRWAGGKTWLIKYLDQIIGDANYNNYFELFLGGASIFLSLEPEHQSFLSDSNEALISTYKVIKENPKDLIETLSTYENTEAFYYDIRKMKFESEIENAAKFIYLNQTSFNGIYRVNLKGEYNVPYGFRDKDFLEIDTISDLSKALQNSNLSSGDFEDFLPFINERDLVFLDPPYTVSHNNNGFIKYNQKIFSLDDQYRLKRFIDKVKKRGAYYILTNAAHEVIVEIFHDDQDRMYELSRASLVGGANAARGSVKEYIFTNLRGRDC